MANDIIWWKSGKIRQNQSSNKILVFNCEKPELI